MKKTAHLAYRLLWCSFWPVLPPKVVTRNEEAFGWFNCVDQQGIQNNGAIEIDLDPYHFYHILRSRTIRQGLVAVRRAHLALL